ncbi:MAG: YIP1 family protein [Microvirga sp.]|nr:YIP1 family protein [Microvirga sp.]
MTLVERAKAIILDPKNEWDRIALEGGDIGTIYRSYAIPLALIPAIAGVIGATVIGLPAPGVGTLRIGFAEAAVSGLIQFVLGLALLYVVAMIIDKLAPNFGGRSDMTAAFKTAAYSWTPAWLAGIFALVPALGFLSLLGLYSVYLLYLGLPRVMGVPQDKALVCTIVVVLISFMLFFALGSLFALAGIG